MARLSCEVIDRTFPDDPTPIGPNDIRTRRWQRHLMFAHCTLGEDWLTAFKLAIAFRDAPLPLEAMRAIADDWVE